ncbi:MAG: potassium-transporting ATPase subunit C, partial [Alphaproteobacteria bacterium]|nr:potassium-transporting ATPase subunit C [Alphaproteobacteria bacterium]
GDPADPSKTTDAPYNASNSMGSNLGPTSKKLVDRVNAAIEAEFAAGRIDIVAADAVTTSASGLDPHISPQFALAQASAVAKARNLSEMQVRALVEANTEGRVLGVIGEPRLNVLLLNMALDRLK